ncbi:hypothetical protein ANCCAN_10675 [Ancylostoma caninum]|uniref:Uncharacterized protein n=1 Tax=Ancylostoma caninum TaxID=29170 RepID=A0A368GJY8_ANCCA|nr:hypothetical protein ANCCAN_10675 [Ancylostoma caninum]
MDGKENARTTTIGQSRSGPCTPVKSEIRIPGSMTSFPKFAINSVPDYRDSNQYAFFALLIDSLVVHHLNL